MIKKIYLNNKLKYFYLIGGALSIKNIDFEKLNNIDEKKYNEYQNKKQPYDINNRYINIFYIFSLHLSDSTITIIQKKSDEFLKYMNTHNSNDTQIINDASEKTLIKFYGGYIPMKRKSIN